MTLMLSPAPFAPRHYVAWTPAEEYQLAEEVEAGLTREEIAAIHERRIGAIVSRIDHRRLSYRWTGRYSLSEIGRMLGVDEHTVSWWVREGWLRATKAGIQMGKYPIRLVSHDGLVRFLAKEQYWHLWDPARITDLALREWTAELRGDIRFLTTREAGKALCLSGATVSTMVRSGRLPAVKFGAWWLIRSDHLVLPMRRRSVVRRSRFSDAEKEYVRARWGLVPAPTIAREIGRPGNQSIHAIAARMGLPKLGRGCWKSRRAAALCGR